ncbi:hypothetical protein V6574_34880 [Streptomyces sp. SM1P]
MAVSAGGPVRQAAVSGARRARCAVKGSPAWAMVCMRCASSGHRREFTRSAASRSGRASLTLLTRRR